MTHRWADCIDYARTYPCVRCLPPMAIRSLCSSQLTCASVIQRRTVFLLRDSSR
nr:MAG TPA: hypothetical protein [Caudoviricetes sp.]